MSKVNDSHVFRLTTSEVIVYTNVILYAMAYQLNRPLEVYLSEIVGNNTDTDHSYTYANLQSWFSLLQTIGALICGMFLDRLGYKYGCVLIFISSACSYYILSISTSIFLLYLSKIPTILQHGYLASQKVICDTVPEGSDRVVALGRLVVSYQIGLTLGPYAGSKISSYWIDRASGYYFVGKVAALISIFQVLLSLLLPNKIIEKKENCITSTQSQQSEIVNTKDTIYEKVYSIFKLVGIQLCTKIISGTANSITATTFPLILKDHFNLNEVESGIIYTAISFTNAISNLFLLSPLIKCFGNDYNFAISSSLQFIAICSLLQCFCFTLPSAPTLFGFLGLSIIYTIFQYLLATSITTDSTRRVKPSSTGLLLSIEHSLFALARVFAPQVAVFLLKSYGPSSPSFIVSCIYLIVLVIFTFFTNYFLNNGIISKNINPSETKDM